MPYYNIVRKSFSSTLKELISDWKERKIVPVVLGAIFMNIEGAIRNGGTILAVYWNRLRPKWILNGKRVMDTML